MITTGMFVSDRYEIIEKIGAGGMSDVYKARDHILGRIVAVKVLKQEFSEDVTFVTKFRTEAQSAASLEHPNIVNIYDVGSEAGIHYIVMEYVEGVTLKTYIEKKVQLTYKEAVSIAIQVGRGIEAAHAKNIIHRDIKPQNILISTEGKAKVTDFGIARAVTNNTISADVMGSVHYASPEQARNGFVDGKSDIYSLGIVMYEMVTGRVPFDGETTVAVAIQHLQEEMTPPSVYANHLPVSLEKIILKCTQKSPDRRYENIGALLVDLKKVLVTPDEDFVTAVTTDSQDKTRVISQEEVKQIKQSRTPVREEKREPLREERKPSRRETYAYEEEEIEDDEEEDDGILNPKIEKAVTIGGIIAAFIIVGIIVYLIGNMTGIFGGSSSKDKADKADKKDKTPISTEAKKKEQVEMIDLKGMTFDEAKTKLHEKGLGIMKAGSQSSDEYEEGLIVSQDIEKGEETDINTTVKVYISSGPAVVSVTVPPVTGLGRVEAMNQLSGEGFEVNVNYAYDDSVEAEKVISQNPSANTSAEKGSTVTLTVSQGKEIKKFAMPNVLGKSQESAKAELEGAGLAVTSTSSDYSDTYEEGQIMSQSPAAGQEVEQGNNVTLTISLGSRVVKYACKATIKAPDSDEVTGADIVLNDSKGNRIQSWDGIKKSKFPYKVSVADIEDSATGTFVITWYLEDGTSNEQTVNVNFTKQ